MEKNARQESQAATQANRSRKRRGGGGGGAKQKKAANSVQQSAEPDCTTSTAAPVASSPSTAEVQKPHAKRRDPNASSHKASKPRRSKAESISLDACNVEEEGKSCAAFYEDVVTSLREYQEYLISVLPTLTERCRLATAPRGLLNRVDHGQEPTAAAATPVESACEFPSFSLVMASLGLLSRHASRPSAELLADGEAVRDALSCAQLIAGFCLIPPELFPGDEDRFAAPLNTFSGGGLNSSLEKTHINSGKKQPKGGSSSSVSGGLGPLELFQRSLSSSSISSVTGNNLVPKDAMQADTNALTTNTTHYSREERDSIDYLISTIISLVSRLSAFGSGVSEYRTVESSKPHAKSSNKDDETQVRVPSLDKLLFHEQLRTSALYLLSAVLIRYPKSVNAVSHFPQLFPPVDIRGTPSSPQDGASQQRVTAREKHPLLTPLLTDPCFPVRCAACFALCRLLRHCHTQLQLAEEDPLTAAKRIQELQEEDGNGEHAGIGRASVKEQQEQEKKTATRPQAYRAPSSTAGRGFSSGPQSFYSLSGQGGRIIDAVHDTLLWGLESNRVDDPVRCAQQPAGNETHDFEKEADSSQVGKDTSAFMRIGTSGLILSTLAALVTASPYARCPYAAYIMTNKIVHFPTVIEFLFGVHRTARVQGSSHTGSGSSIAGYFLNALTFCAAVFKQGSLVPHLSESLRQRSRTVAFSGTDAPELSTPKHPQRQRQSVPKQGQHGSGSWERLAGAYNSEAQKVRESRDLFSVLFSLCLPRMEAWRCALFAAKNYSWVVDCYAEEFLGASLALLQAGRTLAAKQGAALREDSRRSMQRFHRNRRSHEQNTDTSKPRVSLSSLLAAMGKTAAQWGLSGTTRLRTVALCNAVAAAAMAEQTPTRYSEAVDLCLCMWQFVTGSLVEGFDTPKSSGETLRGVSETHAKKRASLAVRQHTLALVLSIAAEYNEPGLIRLATSKSHGQGGSAQEGDSVSGKTEHHIPATSHGCENNDEKQYFSAFRVVAIRSLALRCLAHIGDDAVASFTSTTAGHTGAISSERKTITTSGINGLLQTVCDYATCHSAAGEDPKPSASQPSSGVPPSTNDEAGSVRANSDGSRWDAKDVASELQVEAMSTITMLAWKYPSLCLPLTSENLPDASATVEEENRRGSDPDESTQDKCPSSRLPLSWCLAFIDVAGHCMESTTRFPSHNSVVQRKAMLILENTCTLFHIIVDENRALPCSHPLLCPGSQQQLFILCSAALSFVQRADILFASKLSGGAGGVGDENADEKKPAEAACNSGSVGANSSFTSSVSWATATLTAKERGGENSVAQRQRTGPHGAHSAPTLASATETSTVWSTVGQGLRMIGDLVHVLGVQELTSALHPIDAGNNDKPSLCFVDECLAVLLRHVCTNAELRQLSLSALAADDASAKEEGPGTGSQYFYAYLGDGTSKEATKLRWGAAYGVGVALDRACVFDASPVRAVAAVKALISLVKDDPSSKVKRQAIQALLRIPVTCMEPAFVSRVSEVKKAAPNSEGGASPDDEEDDLNAALLRCVCVELEVVDTPVSSAGDSQSSHRPPQPSSMWDRGNLFASASGMPSWQQSNARRSGRAGQTPPQRTEAIDSFRAQLKEAVQTILQTRAPTAALQRVLAEHNAIIEMSTASGDGPTSLRTGRM